MPNAEKLRKLADGMDGQIQAKRHPAIASQNMTPRRIRIAQHMAREADKLALVQAVLRKIADAYGDPEKQRRLDTQSRGVMSRTSKAALLALPAMELAQIAGDFAPPPDPKAVIRRMEQDLVGVKIDGFFPTPFDTGCQMAELANLSTGLCVLEPSAGKGDLAEALIETQPDIVLEVCEINHRLRGILTAKGFTVRSEFDCLEITDTYDRIVQNPPFEKGLDIQHTMQMYARLTPGGRLVGIVSEGAFFREDKRSQDFRAWLKGKLADEVKLPSGTFTGADVFRQTGVASRIVVLDKPVV